MPFCTRSGDIERKMFKVIFKTAVKTLVIIIIALVLAFGIVSLSAPDFMASAFENCGAYSTAAGYASLQYKYTGDVKDLARCFNDSVYARDTDGTAKYGGALLTDPRFSDYCAEVNGNLSETLPDSYKKEADYMQFVYGKTALAKYSGGDKEGALALVSEALRHTAGFPANNASVEISVKAAENGDGEMKSGLLKIIDSITPSESESDYYNKVKNILIEEKQ